MSPSVLLGVDVLLLDVVILQSVQTQVLCNVLMSFV